MWTNVAPSKAADDNRCNHHAFHPPIRSRGGHGEVRAKRLVCHGVRQNPDHVRETPQASGDYRRNKPREVRLILRVYRIKGRYRQPNDASKHRCPPLNPRGNPKPTVDTKSTARNDAVMWSYRGREVVPGASTNIHVIWMTLRPTGAVLLQARARNIDQDKRTRETATRGQPAESQDSDK